MLRRIAVVREFPSKPPPWAPLNLSHPLTRGLRGLWVATDAGFDLGDRVVGLRAIAVATSGHVSTTETFLGLGQKWDATALTDIGYKLGQTAQLKIAALPLSIATLSVGLGTTGSLFTGLSTDALGLTGNHQGFLLAGSGTSINAQFGDTTGTSASARRSAVVGTVAAGLNLVSCSIRAATDTSIYINGVNQGAPTYSGTGGAMAYEAGASISLGYQDLPAVQAGGAGSIQGTNCIWLMTAIWDRSLSDAEHALLAVNPFAMFGSLASMNLPIPAGGISAPFISSATTVYTPTLTGATAIDVIRDQSVSVSV